MQTNKAIELLKAQVIGAEGPGSILRDFQTSLDYLSEGKAAVSANTRHFTGPVTVALNERLVQRLQHGLKRVGFVSCPNVQGLYILLVTSGLARIDAKRMCLNDDAYAAWMALNPVERYFNLLETWLTRAIHVSLGGNLNYRVSWTITDWFQKLGEGVMVRDPHALERLKFGPGLHNIALTEQFGLCEIEAEPPESGQGWRPSGVRTTPFGEALMSIINEWLHESPWRLWEPQPVGKGLGEMQPLFQSLFPEWRHNLPPADSEGPAGLCTIKVILGTAWRRITVPAHLDLDSLAQGILNLFGFDNEHLYLFVYDGPMLQQQEIYHPYAGDEPYADQLSLSDLPIGPGDTIDFIYDFGDQWRFRINLEKDEPHESGNDEVITLIAQKGRAPAQYS